MSFLYEQLLGRMVTPTTPLNGRNVIVTGSNTGLGLHAAVHLARLSPARIIIAVRDTVKGETAKDTLLSTVPDFKGAVDVWKLDLASFDSVKSFAKKVTDELDRLDILVENAAVFSGNNEWSTTDDGWESALQVNDIATGLLGVLLLPLLKKTAKLPSPDSTVAFKPHLTLVGSEVHGWCKFPEANVSGSILEALNVKPEKFDGGERYNVSKLINVHLAHQFAALAGDDIVVNVVNPGLCISELRRDLGGIFGRILNAMARTGEEGSKNIAWAATADTNAEPGAYISVCSIKESSPYSRSEKGLEAERKVWDELVELWTKLAPETREILKA